MLHAGSRSLEVETYVAKKAIANVLAVHSRGVDRADMSLLASAYHDDATVDYGFFTGSAAGFAQTLSASLKNLPVTVHRTSNRFIAVQDGRAVSESYVIACMDGSDAGAPVQSLVGGRYLDRHSCRAGRWCISHRAFVMDWNTNRPGATDWPAPSVALANFLPRGAHGAADPGRALLALGASAFDRNGEISVSRAASESDLDVAMSKQALEELSAAYARGIDRGDPELLASLFHPDATVVSGVVNGPGREFSRQICEFVTKNLERCFHSVSNCWFDVAGDTAVGEIYVVAMVTAGGNDIMTAGRYVDSYRRLDGVWKFSSRTFVMDWSTSSPTSFRHDGIYSAFKTRGCFGPNDPLYSFWKT